MSESAGADEKAKQTPSSAPKPAPRRAPNSSDSAPDPARPRGDEATSGSPTGNKPKKNKSGITPGNAQKQKPSSAPKSARSKPSPGSTQLARATPPSAALPATPLEEPEQTGDRSTSFLLFAAMPSWLLSLILHVIIILLLTLWYLPELRVFNADLTIGRPDVTETEITNLEENTADLSLETTSSDMAVPDAPQIETDDPSQFDEPVDTEAPQMSVELATMGFEAANSMDLMQEIGSFTGGGLEGRSAAERTRLIREAGGTEGSEQAVKRALLWLKRHQNPDGSWSFYHLGGRCSCRGHGSLADARIGATAIALLPYLGAGNTHMQGNYKAEIQRGLYFLLQSQKPNGSLWEPGGTMYSHGLASIVLCEAYALTGDPALQKPAQAAVNFISYAQDRVTFGWRYQPRDMTGGDTSVVGWMLMALKSGHMANLQIDPNTVATSKLFLNSVQADNGAAYGYMGPGKKNTTTAIGLLCRMYLGWKHDNKALVAGVKRLSESGPSEVNLYYDYYATQVLRHYEGKMWEKWNKKMRDFLVKTQNKKGHAEGSWVLGKDHTNKGGRLYCTAMATMILEVYYRHLPIYGKGAAEDAFQL